MWQQLLNRSSNLVADYLPSIAGALIVLVVGWLVALVVAAIVRGILRRTTIENRMAAWIFGEQKAARMPIEQYCASGAF